MHVLDFVVLLDADAEGSLVGGAVAGEEGHIAEVLELLDEVAGGDVAEENALGAVGRKQEALQHLCRAALDLVHLREAHRLLLQHLDNLRVDRVVVPGAQQQREVAIGLLRPVPQLQVDFFVRQPHLAGHFDAVLDLGGVEGTDLPGGEQLVYFGLQEDGLRDCQPVVKLSLGLAVSRRVHLQYQKYIAIENGYGVEVDGIGGDFDFHGVPCPDLDLEGLDGRVALIVVNLQSLLAEVDDGVMAGVLEVGVAEFDVDVD